VSTKKKTGVGKKRNGAFDRLSLRINTKDKALLVKAAEAEQLSLSKFLLKSALAAAGSGAGSR
jgi:uncharacterized protein (DUF1778 family)